MWALWLKLVCPRSGSHSSMGQVRPIHFLSLHESTLKYDSTLSLSYYGSVVVVVKIRFGRSTSDDGSATGDGLIDGTLI